MTDPRQDVNPNASVRRRRPRGGRRLPMNLAVTYGPIVTCQTRRSRGPGFAPRASSPVRGRWCGPGTGGPECGRVRPPMASTRAIGRADLPMVVSRKTPSCMASAMVVGRWVIRFAGGGGAEGLFTDGKRHGYWVIRQHGGIMEGPYVDGRRHGHWVVRGWGRGRRPIIHVSWDDAKAYADWLTRETGEPYCLLSEPNGSTQRVRARRLDTVGATSLAAIARILKPVTAIDTTNKRRRPTLSRQTGWDFTTPTGTCGSGSRTAGTGPTEARRPTAAHGLPVRLRRARKARRKLDRHSPSSPSIRAPKLEQVREPQALRSRVPQCTDARPVNSSVMRMTGPPVQSNLDAIVELERQPAL